MTRANPSMGGILLQAMDQLHTLLDLEARIDCCKPSDGWRDTAEFVGLMAQYTEVSHMYTGTLNRIATTSAVRKDLGCELTK